MILHRHCVSTCIFTRPILSSKTLRIALLYTRTRDRSTHVVICYSAFSIISLTSMPRSSTSSSPAQLSHAIDLFLHKDRSSFFDDDSIALGTIAPFEPQPALAELPSLNWDLPATCTSDIPAYQYISSKLHQRELSVALIISAQEPYVIPVWPLPRKSQVILAQIIRKAVKKFNLPPSWLTALAAASNKSLPKIFETHQPDSYVVRRSIVQHEVVFSEEGLTLLTIDHVHTFKQLLCTLSKKDWVPHAREVCLSSCVHLLHRINEIYTDPQVSGGYLKRVYKELAYKKESWQEVTSAYNVNYCTASIKDLTTLEPDFTALSDIASFIEPNDESHNQIQTQIATPIEHNDPVAELPDTSPPNPTSDTISPIATVDTWGTQAAEESLDFVSPLTVRQPTLQYPPIKPPSIILESPIDPYAPWIHAVPPPLKTKRISSAPNISPPSAHEAENWLASIPTSREIIESWSKADVSAPVESGSCSEMKAPMDYVRVWVESWSTNGAPGVLCENCHEVAVQPLVPRRFTMA